MKKKLTILKQDKKLYTLMDNKNNIYTIEIDFKNVPYIPTIRNIIVIDEILLDKNNPNYCFLYCFGTMDNEYGRNPENINDEDLMIVENNEVFYKYKRLYG